MGIYRYKHSLSCVLKMCILCVPQSKDFYLNFKNKYPTGYDPCVLFFLNFIYPLFAILKPPCPSPNHPSSSFLLPEPSFLLFPLSESFSSWLALPFHEGLSSNVASPEKFLDIKEPFRCQSLPITCFLHNTYLKLLIYLYACLLYAPLSSKG